MQTGALTKGPLPPLIWKLAAPMSIGYFFHTMFNITDTWFAGRISTEAMAALSLSFPVFFIILAVGYGLGTGTTALVGGALGKGDARAASDFAGQALAFSILVSVFLTLAGLWSAPGLFRFLGASRDYLGTSLAYMNVIFYASVLFLLAFVFNGILFALGDTRPNRNFLVVAFFVNLLLDPWFIYGGFGLPPLGIAGIGIATLLCEAGGVLYLGVRTFRSGVLVCPRLRCFLPNKRVIVQVMHQGLPAAFSMFTVGGGIFVITYFVGKFGQEAVAAYGIAVRVEHLAVLPAMGLNTATLALVAQNSGAGLGDRVRESLRLAVAYGGKMMLPVGAGVFLAAEPLIGLFTADPRVVSAGAGYLRVDALVFWAYVILYVNVSALQGMKRPMFAVWIGVLRQFVFPVAVFWLLTGFFDCGLMGIWMGILGITWTAALYALYYAKRTVAKAFPVPPH